MPHRFTNRLAQETSPYLLQHAHNPVDWYPWSEEAFALAREQNKPVLVSIGYAACHWCHVMERESFENETVAAYMNSHFINIKVDREERPDVDHIYMDALQAISGSGGWPLNVFLTPDGKPFYGGTYFPPQRAFNRSSWMEVLQSITTAYRERREEIETQATNLTEHLKTSNAFGASNTKAVFSPDKIDEAFAAVMKQADKEWGGFGRAPKFPQSFTIVFLLRYAHFTGNEEAKDQALLSLDKMIQGGIYDHIGGGFARYSTDTEWLAPHFEKMLYDNALLVSALCEAYKLTGKREYKEVLEETLAFVDKELSHPEGGFFSAIDADSEGEEGKYYVWDQAEVEALLGDRAALFSEYYDITAQGNWEGHNIPRRKQSLSTFAAEKKLDEGALEEMLAQGKKVLATARDKRIRPLLDDKVLLGWNALMNKAYSQAYAATGNETYLVKAQDNMNFLLSHFTTANGGYLHTWKNGQGKFPAFLDDYAYLIDALLELATVTADYSWLLKAKEITGFVLKHFSDSETSLFFYTADFQKDILLRKKEIYDGAVPSGNAVMAGNLYRLGIMLDERELTLRSEALLSALVDVAVRYPTSFGVWTSLYMQAVYGSQEIAIVGEEYGKGLKNVLSYYLPHTVIMAAASGDDSFPLLAQKKMDEKTLYFLCENYACRQPVTSPEALKLLINQNKLRKIQ